VENVGLWWCCLTPEVRDIFFQVWLSYNPAGGSYVTLEDYDAILASYGHSVGSLDYNAFASMAMLVIGEIAFPPDEIIDVFFFGEPRGLAVWSYIGMHGTICFDRCKLLTFPA